MAARLLLDTNVVVDFLRNRAEAVGYIRGLTDRPLLSSITAGELYAGVRDGPERMQLDRLIIGFRVVPLTREMGIEGGLYVRKYAKSHSVGLADALIAATAHGIGARLVTLNRKHFPMLTDVLVPYTTP
jgi:hypothetical protein